MLVLAVFPYLVPEAVSLLVLYQQHTEVGLSNWECRWEPLEAWGFY
jgi:hypothetical protein